MLTTEIAYSTLIALIGVLGIIFLFLLGYTLWTRAKKRYWKRYKKKFRDYFLPMLLEFVEGDPSISDADELIKKLTKRRQDILFFLELMEEMTDLLKGEDRDKLDLLIEHEMFYRFYREKLFSSITSNKLLACSYFESISTINDRIGARLVSLSKSSNVKLAFGATKALQASGNMVVRRNALIRFLKRDDVSELMISEVLHYFRGGSEWKQQQISRGIKQLLLEGRISAQNKRIVVLFAAHMNYFELGDFLMQYLTKLQYNTSKAPLISGLIEALGKLHVQESASIIQNYVKVQDEELRLTCVEALGRLGDEKNFVFLVSLLLQVEFSVRKKIIQILTNHDVGVQIINRFLIGNQEFLAQFKQQQVPEDLKEIIRNIHDTVRGVQIMLPKQTVAHT